MYDKGGARVVGGFGYNHGRSRAGFSCNHGRSWVLSVNYNRYGTRRGRGSVQHLSCLVSSCCCVRVVFSVQPSSGLPHSAGAAGLSCTQRSEAGVPWGSEPVVLANHRSGQVFCRVVLWFGRGVPDPALDPEPIVSLTVDVSGKQRSVPHQEPESFELVESSFWFLSQVQRHHLPPLATVRVCLGEHGFPEPHSSV